MLGKGTMNMESGLFSRTELLKGCCAIVLVAPAETLEFGVYGPCVAVQARLTASIPTHKRSNLSQQQPH
jgi:hypothetical protein